MLIKSKRQLTTFRQAALQIQTKNSNFTGTLMGLVVDASRPLARQRDKDFIVQLKLVDQSLNENKMYGILIRYCSVYLFSKTSQELQICNTIGQTVLLDQFSLSIWNEIKLQTKYLSSIERIYCLQIKEGQLKQHRSLLSTNEELDLTAIHFKQRALELHKWFQEYFSKTHRPLLGIALINNYSIMADPFNMILQRPIQPSSKIQKQNQDRLFLQDSHKNIFFIHKNSLGTNLPDSKFVFVRGIQYIGNFYEIVLTDTGGILGLPINCQQYYLKAMNYCAVSRFNQKFMLKSHKACQLSKLSYVTTKTTPIIELLNNIQMYQNRRSVKDELHIQDLYMIEAVVINFSGNLRLFHTEHQLLAHQDFVKNLSSDERKEMMQSQQLAYLYQGSIGVMDRSSQCTGRLLFVHLFSNEDRTQFFDPAAMKQLNKGAHLITNRQLQVNTKAKIEAKLQNLIQQSDFTNTVSMLVQPIKSDVLLFRLIHTIFT